MITLEFQRSDGTLVTQLVDFKNVSIQIFISIQGHIMMFKKILFVLQEVQVIKALVLGEEERGQNQFQTMCFVNHFYKMDFISSDAMSKLRQKNPGTIRTAEDDKGHANYTMDLFLDVSQSSVVSKHISELCSEAADSTFTRYEDIKQWAQRPGEEPFYLIIEKLTIR